ncbi:hypothetical protein RUND412_008697, partial [Rhizina undulata]
YAALDELLRRLHIAAALKSLLKALSRGMARILRKCCVKVSRAFGYRASDEFASIKRAPVTRSKKARRPRVESKEPVDPPGPSTKKSNDAEKSPTPIASPGTFAAAATNRNINTSRAPIPREYYLQEQRKDSPSIPKNAPITSPNEDINTPLRPSRDRGSNVQKPVSRKHPGRKLEGRAQNFVREDKRKEREVEAASGSRSVVREQAMLGKRDEMESAEEYEVKVDAKRCRR